MRTGWEGEWGSEKWKEEHREVMAWANGNVEGIPARGKRLRYDSTTTTSEHIRRNDCIVDTEKLRIRGAAKGARDNHTVVDQMCKAVGSNGTPAVAALEYYEPTLMQPYAMYHLTYQGTGKTAWAFVNARLVAALGKDAKGNPLVAAFSFAKPLKRLLLARLEHFVLRSDTRCRLVNFVEHLSAMTIAEMQLLFEVAMPYLLHDMAKLGVPEEVVLMLYVLVLWEAGVVRDRHPSHPSHPSPPPDFSLVCRLLMRHAFMKLTRVVDEETEQEYRHSMGEARAAMFACMCIAQQLCDGDYRVYGMTFKGHCICAHAVAHAESRGHATMFNDMWVERMLRAYGVRYVRCERALAAGPATDLPYTAGCPRWTWYTNLWCAGTVCPATLKPPCGTLSWTGGA